MSLPYERFLRFLVSRKANIRATLDRCGLPYPGDLWFSRARTAICKCAPPAIFDYINGDSPTLVSMEGVLEWARSEGFSALWKMQPEFGELAPSPELTLAYRVFQNPYSRSLLGLLVMANIGLDETQSIIRARFTVELNEGSIHIFKTLFWDPSLASRQEWGPFLRTLREWEERNLLALAFSSPSIEEIRHALDLPSEVDPDAVMRTVMNKAYQRFKAALDDNQVRIDDSNARAWGELAFRAAKEVSKPRPKSLDEGVNGKGVIDYEKIFSVIPEKTKIVSYAEIHGEVQMPKIAAKSE